MGLYLIHSSSVGCSVYSIEVGMASLQRHTRFMDAQYYEEKVDSLRVAK